MKGGNTSSSLLLLLLSFILALLSVFLLTFGHSTTSVQLQTPYGFASIHTDSYGIPTISGSTHLAISYATGYVQAKDRLWAMHFLRLFASGRLSETFGSDMVELDKLMRSVGFLRFAKTMPHAPNNFLSAFTEGINHYVENSLMLPLEFYLIGTRFDPWRVEDSLLVSKLMSFESSYRWIITVSRQAILEKYGKSLADIVIPLELDKDFGDLVTILNEAELKQMGLYRPKDQAEPDLAFNFITDPVGRYWKRLDTKEKKAILSTMFAGASNSWAVHGNYTKSGKPLIACDPHLGTRVPSILYLAKLKFGTTNFYGAMLPGVPYVLYGRNDYVAWGTTVSYMENIDLFRLKVNPEVTHYYYNNTWVPLKIIKETIEVKDSASVTLRVYETHHGPVIFPPPKQLLSVPSFGLLTLVQDPVAIAWKGFKQNDTAILGSYELMTATNTEEAINALKHYGSAGEGIVFATVQRDIGYKAVGVNYKRKSIKESNYFRDGTNPAHDWIEPVPEEQAPILLNPAKGYIVNCNNGILPENLTESGIGSTMIGNVRANKVDQVIAKHIKQIKDGKSGPLEIKDMIELQNDFYDGYAEKVLPKMVKLTKKYASNYSLEGKQNHKIEKMLTKLDNWDYFVLKNKSKPLIYSVWISELKKTLLHQYYSEEDEREAHTFSFSSDNFVANLVFKWSRNQMLDSDICRTEANQNTTNRCVFNLIHSLIKTYEFLAKALGPDMKNWKYRYLHAISYPHQPLSMTPLKVLFHRERSASGNKHTLNVASFDSAGGNYNAIHAANYRLVADMDKIENTYSVLDTGESGNFLSEHYFDMNDLYMDGEYVKY